MNTLFTLPKQAEDQTHLLGMLAFFEDFEPIKSKELGLVIYNFDVKEVVLYNNQIFFTGTPLRTGAQVLALDREDLDHHKDYILRLVTPDFEEADYAILKEWNLK